MWVEGQMCQCHDSLIHHDHALHWLYLNEVNEESGGWGVVGRPVRRRGLVPPLPRWNKNTSRNFLGPMCDEESCHRSCECGFMMMPMFQWMFSQKTYVPILANFFGKSKPDVIFTYIWVRCLFFTQPQKTDIPHLCRIYVIIVVFDLLSLGIIRRTRWAT